MKKVEKFSFLGRCQQCSERQPHPPHLINIYIAEEDGERELFCPGLAGGDISIELEVDIPEDDSHYARLKGTWEIVSQKETVTTIVANEVVLAPIELADGRWAWRVTELGDCWSDGVPVTAQLSADTCEGLVSQEQVFEQNPDIEVYLYANKDVKSPAWSWELTDTGYEICNGSQTVTIRTLEEARSAIRLLAAS